MPRIIHRVFVSSTFEDLREERAEVQKALLKLGCFPVGMELFPSADDETWEFIKRQIDESDYYIVIVAGKYGSIAGDGLSFTQKEWLYARETQKPSIAFLHAEPGSIIADKTERDADRRDKLATFQADLKRSPICTFRNAHELAAQVTYSLVDLKERHPRPGFVRADEVADLQKYTSLLEEVTLLRAKLAGGALVPFAGAEDDFVFTIRYRRTISGVVEEVEIKTGCTLSEIFVAVADTIIRGTGFGYEIPNAVAERIGRSSLDETEYANASQFSTSAFEDFFGLLLGIGLLSFDTESYGEKLGRSYREWSATRTIWKLTDYGREQYGLQHKMRIFGPTAKL